jgi:hypothetical protein
MKIHFFIQLIFWTGAICLAPAVVAQRVLPRVHLVLDQYGAKRIRLPAGTEIHYRLKGDRNLYRDYIGEFWEADSAILLVQARTLIKLNEFEAFYFRRNWVRAGSAGLGFIGGGFTLAAISAPLFPVRFYDPAESAVLGGSALLLSQGIKLFRWKKFKVRPGKSRVRILNTSFGPI